MMRRMFNSTSIATSAIAALLLCIGAVAMSRAEPQDSAIEHMVPVSYHENSAPTISDDDAARAIASAQDLSTAFRVASERVMPSVVTIENRPKPVEARQRNSQPNPFGGENPFKGTPFEDMFRDRGFGFETPNGPQSPGPGGMGSGVIIDSHGLILTNNHVVAGDGDVSVRLSDGREFKAVNVWTDPSSDIAVVKIDASGLTAAPIGDSDVVSVGEWVIAVGQPFGLESTVTAGIISAKHRGIGITARENFLQTDAAINPGNSGGALVNLKGELVGINTAISSRGGGNDGIGFAVPINLAKWVADQLVNEGTVRRAYLGVGIQPVTASLAEQFQVKPREGVVVTQVYANTPAEKAGVQAGDVIVEFAGVKVNSPNELQTIIERAELGKRHILVVVRNGARKELNFIPEVQPSQFGSANSSEESSKAPETAQANQLGIEVSDLDEATAKALGLDSTDGVVVTQVERDSRAARAGLRPGMVITQVNRQDVQSVADFQMLVGNDENETILLLVRTESGSRFVIVE